MKLYLSLFILTAVANALTAETSSVDRPNILVILTDDLGYGDVSSYRPGADVRTPHIDRLADEGMRFTRMRANATVCSPTRAALMTGRHADAVGVPGLIRTDPLNTWGYLDPKVPTLADLLGESQFDTAIIGKWNLGLTVPGTPNERGFDFFHGFLDDMMDSYTTHLRHGHNYMRRNHEVIDPKGHATDIFTDWTCDYLRERGNKKRPFFLYLAYNAPHFPIEPPSVYLARVKQRAPQMEEKRALNVAMVEHLDACVGRVMRVLEEMGLAENTLLFFTSDNGAALRYAQNNDPWRDGKQSHYDGGLRIPFIVRWPGHIAPGTLSDYAGQIFDIFATSLEVAGVSPPREMNAVSLLSILGGKAPPTGVRELYFVRREGGATYGGKSYEALIRGDWKLMQNSPYSPLELYNLTDDPFEQNNVISQNAAVARELQSVLRKHIQRGGAAAWQPPDLAPRT